MYLKDNGPKITHREVPRTCAVLSSVSFLKIDMSSVHGVHVAAQGPFGRLSKA